MPVRTHLRRRKNEEVMRLFWETIERRELTQTLRKLQQGIRYDTWRNRVLWRICSKLVKERIKNLRVVSPVFAHKVEEYIVKMYLERGVNFVDYPLFQKIVNNITKKETRARLSRNYFVA